MRKVPSSPNSVLVWRVIATGDCSTWGVVPGKRLHLDYAGWVDRMRTPQVMREAIRALQNAAVDAVRDHFQIDADGSFSTDVLVLWAVR